MGRVEDHHIGFGHPLLDTALRHLKLNLANTLFDFRPAVAVFLLVLDFLLGHFQFLGHRPALKRHVDHRNQRQHHAQHQHRQHQQPQPLTKAGIQRLAAKKHQSLPLAVQNARQGAAEQADLEHGLEQLHQGLLGEHALQTGQRIQPLELGLQAVPGQQKAAGHQSGNHQQH